MYGAVIITWEVGICLRRIWESTMLTCGNYLEKQSWWKRYALPPPASRARLVASPRPFNRFVLLTHPTHSGSFAHRRRLGSNLDRDIFLLYVAALSSCNTIRRVRLGSWNMDRERHCCLNTCSLFALTYRHLVSREVDKTLTWKGPPAVIIICKAIQSKFWMNAIQINYCH